MGLLLFGSEIGNSKWHIVGVSNVSIVQTLLFLGLTHIWLGVFKKQLRYPFLRQHAYSISIVSGMCVALFVELLHLRSGNVGYFNFANLIMSFAGVFLGIGTFRLLYRSCC